MGSVCASTLALLNAGVPLKAPVAGASRWASVSDDIRQKGASTLWSVASSLLTDILGAEDAPGDMDFKVADQDFGHRAAVGHQADGIPFAGAFAGALEQAKDVASRSWR